MREEKKLNSELQLINKELPGTSTPKFVIVALQFEI